MSAQTFGTAIDNLLNELEFTCDWQDVGKASETKDRRQLIIERWSCKIGHRPSLIIVRSKRLSKANERTHAGQTHIYELMSIHAEVGHDTLRIDDVVDRLRALMAVPTS